MLQDFFFIEPELKINPAVKQPASYVRKSFFAAKTLKCATLHMTALGVYIGYLNGERLDGHELLPGCTDYHLRVQYQTFDVTGRILPGENVLGAVIGDGWYRGCLSIGSKRNQYGEKTKFACRLELEYEDAGKEYIESGIDWRATQNGPLRENDLKTAEHYDARMELAGWNAPGFDDSAWHGVTVSSYTGSVIPQEGEAVLAHEKFSSAVLHTPDGGVTLDFGQNMAGRITFTVTGRAGHAVTLTMGETLDEHGNFTQKNLKAEGAGLISGELGQKLEYTLKEGTQTFTPMFLISGFRYVKLDNWPEEVKAENFSAAAVYADMPFVGSFKCSNPLINQLVENVRWSMKSNFVDIPTDCPTRERSGWIGDISLFVETACFLADPRKFLQKWLHDYMLEQMPDGNLPYVVPAAAKPLRAWGCMGWSDGIANLAMTLYRFYGDKAILEEVYDAVRRFIEFCRSRAKKKNPLLFFKPGKHRKYIIETGFHYGEWLEPGTAMFRYYIKDLFLPDTEVTTAQFYYSTRLLAEMAKLLDKKDHAECYTALANQIRQAYHREFLKNGRVQSKRQCRYVRPVAAGLLNEEESHAAIAELNKKIIANQYKIGTGFLTTWRVMDVLTQYGYLETAYKMLENTLQPGWLFSVTKGATTVWENWYGINEAGVPVDSHNHYAPGAVASWLFSVCAGIKSRQPGFAEVHIEPKPGGTLTWAKAEYQSCKGKIVSAWRIEGELFILDVELPEGIHGTIVLPNGETHAVTGGKHSFAAARKNTFSP